MSKKRKKQTRVESSPTTRTFRTVGNVPRPAPVEFNPDYAYVKKDLRRIGILAGTFISILIILTFFLR
jgi:hypothetical protein